MFAGIIHVKSEHSVKRSTLFNRRLPLLTLLLLMAAAGSARLSALPRFSLLTGTRCSACHFNPQGSGLRNELGWSTMNQVGAISPSSLGLDSLYASETNSFLDGLFTLGLDARLQWVKTGRPPVTERRTIPMQLSPYLAFSPSEQLHVFGTYNAGPIRYPGQTSFDAQVLYQPDITLPAIRAGFIQPSISIRGDDHTMFTRRDAASPSPVYLLAPNYNELGGELVYEGQHWLTLNVGVFSAHNLHKAIAAVDSTKPSFSARAVFWPQLLDQGINMELGASILTNGPFKMINAFGGFGLADKATIYVEGMFAQNPEEIDPTSSRTREIRNMMVQGSYQLWQWLALEWRYEWGQTEYPTEGPSYRAQSFIVGAQFFPIPYLEIRPEYRYFQNADYLMGQYTVQVHAFY